MAKQVEWSKYQFFEVVVAIYRRKESVMKLWIHHFYNINKLFTNKGIINNFSRFRIRNIYRNIISSDLTAHSYKSSFCNKAFYQTKTQTNSWPEQIVYLHLGIIYQQQAFFDWDQSLKKAKNNIFNHKLISWTNQ